MAARAKHRVTPLANRWPERDPSKHNLSHFEKFFSTLRMPDGIGNGRLQDFQLAKLADYFSEWAPCTTPHVPGVTCADCYGVGKVITRPGFFQNLHLEPTGQGKSTLMAALALHHCTYVRVDPRAYVLGGLGAQADNTMEAARGFIERSRDLAAWYEAQKYQLGIIRSLHPEDSEDAGIIASSAGRRVGGRAGAAQEGKGPTWIGAEELHRHEDNGTALATLISKVQKRSHPFAQVQVLIVTTAGDSLDAPLGRMLAQVTDEENGATVETDLRPGEYYRRCVDADGDLVAHEWALPDGIPMPERHARPEVLNEYLQHVKKANPASMVTVRSLRLSYRALLSTPWVWQRQHCNSWVTSDFAALDRYGWRAGNQGRSLEIPAGAMESHLQRGTPAVYVGLDTALKWDRTAVVPVWVDPESGRPRTAGAVILGSEEPGAQRRARKVFDVLDAMRKRWPNYALVFDRSAGGGLIAEQLEEDHGHTVVDFVQKGAAMEHASMLLAELVDQRRVDHDGNVEVERHVLSAVMRKSHYGRRWRLDQPRSGEPIDAAVALAMGVWVALHPPEPARPPIDLTRFRITPP